MLSGRIRPVDTKEITLEAESVAAARARAQAQVPAGWAMTDVAVTMAKASVMISLSARFARRDGATDIEAEDMASLRALVPEGWQLLSVRES